jgi:hypothetical protein
VIQTNAALTRRTASSWLDLGCIVFSQYYDTTRWVGEKLSERFATEHPGKIVAVYAGASKSGILIDGEWKSVKRESIKRGVKEGLSRWSLPPMQPARGLTCRRSVR